MRHILGLGILFAMSVALTAAPVPKEKPAAKDEDAIIGTWAFEKIDHGVAANPLPEERVKRMKMMFKKEGKLAQYRGDSSKEGEYKLDPSAKVKTIDLISNGRTTLGIYELDGDTLKICIPGTPMAPRPTEMKPDPTNSVSVATLKRVKEDSGEAKKPEAKEAAKPAPEKK